MSTLEQYHRFAVLLLGGKGTRFGGSLPKQFLPFHGKLLFLYPLEKLVKNKNVEAIVLVVPKDKEKFVRKVVDDLRLKKILAIVVGGPSRQESSRRGVSYLRDHGASFESLVLIQDADRPNLEDRYIDETYAKAEKAQIAVTAIPSTDSVAVSEDHEILDRYYPRDQVFLLQTPQTAKLALLYQCHEKAALEEKDFTDEGNMILTLKGISPAIVLGDKHNVKVTTEDDLSYVKGETK
jgi:2-C-methyl-D-erythritol 4-phosphate cytidylyltransferase